MKKLFLLWLVLLLVGCTYGQAKYVIVVYNNTHQPGTSIELPYEPKVVHAIIDNYFSKDGAMSEDLNGFKTFRNSQFVRGDSINADLYFKVAPKSRSEKDQSIVYLMVGMPNEDITVRKLETHFTRDQARDFLNNLASVSEAYNLEMEIKHQHETVIKAEKRYNNLVDGGAHLTNRKKVNEQKLLSNKYDQDKQNAKVEVEKQILAQLVDQRNN